MDNTKSMVCDNSQYFSNRNYRKVIAASILTALLVCALAAIVCGCSSQDTESKNVVDYCTSANIDGMDFTYTERDINGSYADKVVDVNLTSKTSADDAKWDNNVLTLSDEATYVLSGDIKDGQVKVDAKDKKVQIVLNNANIENQYGPAILISDCKKAFITSKEGTTNTVSDGQSYKETSEDSPNAAIYSKEDLTINGQGILNVNGNYDHGVFGKDDLTICCGTINATALGDAIRGKDCVKIKSGKFNLVAGDAGIKSSEKDKDDKGYVSIDGGEFTIKSVGNGIKGQTYVRLCEGTASIAAGYDGVNCNVRADVNGGSWTINAEDDGIHSEAELNINKGNVNIETSYEGLEAEVVNINDGNVNIFATDDGINCAAAEWNSSYQDDKKGDVEPDKQGFSAGNGTGQDAGQGGPGASGNSQGGQGGTGNGQGGMGGFGGQGGMGQGGTPPEMPSDMQGGMGGQGGFGGSGNGQGGMGAQGGTPPEMPSDMQGGQGGMGGQGGDAGGAGGPGFGMSEAANCKLTINGGKLTIDAYGDGIDSNKDFEMNGGTVLVNGPVSGGDSPFDYGETGTGVINGGTFIAIGSSGMAESFSGGKQPFALASATGNSGQVVSVADSSGKELVSITATKTFQCVLVSCPSFSTNSSYTIKVDSTTSTTVTPSTSSQKLSGSAGMGGMGGGFGGGSNSGQGGFGGMGGFGGGSSSGQGGMGGFGGGSSSGQGSTQGGQGGTGSFGRR